MILGIDEKVSVFREQPLKIRENCWVTVENDSYKTSTNINQRIIKANYPFIFKNLLPCPLFLYLHDLDDALVNLKQGEDISFLELNPNSNNHSYKFVLKLENETTLETENSSLNLDKPRTHLPLHGNYNGNYLTIERTDYGAIPVEIYDLSGRKKAKSERNKAIKAQMIEVYCKYLLVNRTEYPLEIGSLSLKDHSLGLFKHSKKLRIRIADSDRTRQSA